MYTLAKTFVSDYGSKPVQGIVHGAVSFNHSLQGNRGIEGCAHGGLLWLVERDVRGTVRAGHLHKVAGLRFPAIQSLHKHLSLCVTSGRSWEVTVVPVIRCVCNR